MLKRTSSAAQERFAANVHQFVETVPAHPEDPEDRADLLNRLCTDDRMSDVWSALASISHGECQRFITDCITCARGPANPEFVLNLGRHINASLVAIKNLWSLADTFAYRLNGEDIYLLDGEDRKRLKQVYARLSRYHKQAYRFADEHTISRKSSAASHYRSYLAIKLNESIGEFFPRRRMDLLADLCNVISNTDENDEITPNAVRCAIARDAKRR
jgi:predicted house-cleaning noncanonical NTP pyrophosphatase (MazG superfamily)